MIAGGNRPSLTEARAETGGGVMGLGQLIQSNILLKTNFFDSLRWQIVCHLFFTIWASATITGIFTIESRVERETSRTESFVSLSNLSENMVTVAPTGALSEITIEVSKAPRMPHTYKSPRTASGYTSSRSKIQA